mmetsp:Transcript_3123/g.4601  ORF Transcript_3123/g.4601 Transcript_3123/m.4601 type:complete len:603 (-) Transcript_3123:73-1881(-)
MGRKRKRDLTKDHSDEGIEDNRPEKKIKVEVDSSHVNGKDGQNHLIQSKPVKKENINEEELAENYIKYNIEGYKNLYDRILIDDVNQRGYVHKASKKDTDSIELNDAGYHKHAAYNDDLKFVHVKNEGTPSDMLLLTKLKKVYTMQLPNMGHFYISKLVFDVTHRSLVAMKSGNIVGGITYKPFGKAFIEIAFVAVDGTYQIRGCGRLLMNNLKRIMARDEKIYRFLTYADNEAVGYFQKMGFSVDVTCPKVRYKDYIKTYEGVTLMECIIRDDIQYWDFTHTLTHHQKQLMDRINHYLVGRREHMIAASQADTDGDAHPIVFDGNFALCNGLTAENLEDGTNPNPMPEPEDEVEDKKEEEEDDDSRSGTPEDLEPVKRKRGRPRSRKPKKQPKDPNATAASVPINPSSSRKVITFTENAKYTIEHYTGSIYPGLYFENSSCFTEYPARPSKRVEHLSSIPGLKKSLGFHLIDQVDVSTIQQLRQHFRAVIDNVKKQEASEIFRKPVKGVDDYDEYIRKKLGSYPIDITLIETRLNQGFYRRKEVFIQDWLRMFQNCREYNGASSSYGETANQCEKAFFKQMTRLKIISNKQAAKLMTKPKT